MENKKDGGKERKRGETRHPGGTARQNDRNGSVSVTEEGGLYKTGEDDENVKDTLVAFFPPAVWITFCFAVSLAMRGKSTPQKVRETKRRLKAKIV